MAVCSTKLATLNDADWMKREIWMQMGMEWDGMRQLAWDLVV